MSTVNLTYLLSDALATEWMMTLEGCQALQRIYYDALDQKKSGSLRVADIERLWAKHEAEGVGESLHMLRNEEGRMAAAAKPLEGSSYTSVYKNIAIIDVIGPMVPRVRGMSSGSVGAQQIRNDFIRAFESDDIKAILLNVDSPGGDARGISELAQTIHKARKKNTKWIYAYAAGFMASAAYFISAAAHRIVANDWASVGSIGVVIGVPPTTQEDPIEFVSTSSPYKRPDISTDEGRRVYQDKADYMGTLFIEAVAELRGVTVEKVISDFGKGGTLVGKQAKTAGLVDAIGTFDSTLHSLITSKAPSGPVLNETATETKSSTRNSESMLKDFGAAGLLFYQKAVDIGLISGDALDSIEDDAPQSGFLPSNSGGTNMATDAQSENTNPIRTFIGSLFKGWDKEQRALAIEELKAGDSDNGTGKANADLPPAPMQTAAPPPPPVAESDEVRALREKTSTLEKSLAETNKKLAAQEDAERQKDAEAFAGNLVVTRVILPASKEKVQALYLQSALDDAAEPLEKGSRVENFKSMFTDLPKHTLTTEYLKTDLPAGSMVLNPDPNNQEEQLKAAEESTRNWAKRQNQRGALTEVK